MKIPDWFSEKVNIPYESHAIKIDGKIIKYRRWGEARKPGLIMVHGNGAHSHWWDFIAPFFIDHYSVIALDLGGMGDSEHRPLYTSEIFVNEVMEVCGDAKFQGKPVLIGHSMGGKIVMKAGNMFANHIKGVIMIDSPCLPSTFQLPKSPKRTSFPSNKVYKTAAEIIEKFRLIPSQTCENIFILEYIAEKSIKEVNGGWSWKFDGQLNERFDFKEIMIERPLDECKVLGFIYGDNSKMFSKEISDYNYSIFGKRTAIVKIQNAGHHLLLDQPLQLTFELKKILADNGCIVD